MHQPPVISRKANTQTTKLPIALPLWEMLLVEHMKKD